MSETPRQRRLRLLRKLAELRGGSVTLGPVEPQGVVVLPEEARAIDPIQAGLRIAQSESNQPAMQRSREAMRPTAAGTAADIAFSQVVSPVFPRTAESAADQALARFVAGGGNATENANLFGAASALGAVGGNYGLMRAIPNVGMLRAGMSAPEIVGALARAGVTEGATGAALAGGGSLAEGASPEDAAKSAAQQFVVQGSLGAAGRALFGLPAIRQAMTAKPVVDVDLDRLTGRESARIIRDDTQPTVVSRDAAGNETLSNGKVIRGPRTFEEVMAIPFRSQQMLDRAGVSTPSVIGGTAGGVGGAAYGYATGDTPEERLRRAVGFGAAGATLGALAGRRPGSVALRGPEVVPEAIAEARAVERAPRVAVERQAFREAPPVSVDPSEYVNLSKMGLEEDATRRLAAEVERIGPQVQGSPRRVATWDEWRDAAKSLGLDDVTRGDFKAMDAPILLANRNLIARNTDQLVAIDDALRNPALSAEERNTLALRGQALDAQNDILLRRFMKGRTEAGQRLNSLRIVANRNLDPAWWLAKGTDIAGRSLTSAEQALIRQRIQVGDKAGLVDLLAGLRESTVGEKALTFWRANLLTNPSTHTVNIGANAVLGAFESAKDVPAALYDDLLGRVTGNRTIAGLSRDQLRASGEGAVEGVRQMRNALQGIRTPEELARYDIPRDVNFDSPVLDAYTKFVFRSLGAEDRVFRYAAMQRSLQNQAEVVARSEGLTGYEARVRAQLLRDHPTPDMAMRAVGDAEQATVNDATSVGRVLGAVHNWSPLGVPVGGLMVPFARTPGAVATRVGEYTLGLPAGLAQVGVKAAQGELSGMPPEAQRELAKLLGRGTTGAAVMAAGGLLAKYGLLTPPSPDPLTERGASQTQQMIGEQGNSLVIGDTQIEVGRLSPMGNLLAIGAMAYHAATDDDPATTPLTTGAAGAVRTVTDQPFLQGIDQAREAMSGEGGAVGRWGGNVARGFVPASSLMGAVARSLDPIVRRAPDPLSQVQSGIPGLSQGLEPRISPLGAPQQREPGVLGAVSNIVSPGRIRTRETDPVSQAIRETGLVVGPFQRKAGESESDFTRRASASGRRRKAKLEEVVASEAYQQADTAGRKELLEAALREAASEQAAETRRLTPRQRKLRDLRSP